jgi:hypothetical protein
MIAYNWIVVYISSEGAGITNLKTKVYYCTFDRLFTLLSEDNVHQYILSVTRGDKNDKHN